jgi:protein ImuA
MPSPTIETLRRRIKTLEGGKAEGRVSLLPLGLPGFAGLETGALHEIAPAALAPLHDGAALGFAAFVLGRQAALRGRPVLWLAEGDAPHAPGLAAFGLGPERLVMALPGRSKAALWALEEAARSTALAAVLAEVRGMDFTAARRLHLAARDGGGLVLLLNRAESAIAPAWSRWRVGGIAGTAGSGAAGSGAAGSGADGCWRLDLARLRGRSPDERGVVARWEVQWEMERNGTAHRLGLAAPAEYRPAVPDGARVA